MHLRYRSVLLLVAICTALAVAPALAAKPTPSLLPSNGIQGHVSLGPNSASANPCVLGIDPVSAPPANAFGYILPPDDEYLVYLDPTGACGPCTGNTFRVTKAHILLYFTAPCQIPVTVSLVGVDPSSAPGCPQPNAFDERCPGTQYLVDDAGITGACVDYSFDMDPACCFQGPIFLKVRFDQGTCPNSRPAFCGPASCSNCRQYNYYPGGPSPQGDDLCAVLSPQGVFGVNEWADVTCCQAVPTLPGTWGKVKTIYR